MKFSRDFVAFCSLSWIVVIAAAKICPHKDLKTVSLTTSNVVVQHSPGELIFEETFDTFNLATWKHEISMAGKSNGEFQMYDSYPENSYVRDGILYIKPTYTADRYGDDFLVNGVMDLGDRCTDKEIEHCHNIGSKSNDIINPIISARINTRDSFAFLYGKVEVRAQIPSGDWVWPAIWLMPQANKYGMWPMSGEIDVMESRGNRELFLVPEKDIGSNQVGSTLHFGKDRQSDPWRLAHYTQNNKNGFNSDFHKYGVIWTPDNITFTLDEREIGTVTPPDGGFWEMGHFEGDKIWSDEKISPFDQMFYVILNVAVGGTSGYFPENTKPKQKPWKNSSPHAKLDFWEARNEWKPTWNDEDSAMKVDYVRVWAL